MSWKEGVFLFKLQSTSKNNPAQLRLQAKEPSGQAENGSLLVWLVLFLCGMSGVYGLFYAVSLIPYFQFERMAVFLLIPPVCLLVCSLIWFGRRFKWLWIGAGAVVLAALGCSVPRLLEEWAGIIQNIPKTTADFAGVNITATVLWAMVLYTFLLYAVCFVWRKGWLFYIVSLLVLFCGPLIGASPDFLEVCLFVIFHIGCGLIGHLGISSKGKSKWYTSAAGKAAAGGILVSVGLFAGLFGLSFGVTWNGMDTLYDVPLTIQQQLQTVITRWFSLDTGSVNRGDNQPSAQDRLEITLSRPAEEKIYIKDFTGAEYTGSSWKAADENTFLREAAAQPYWPEGYSFEQFENRMVLAAEAYLADTMPPYEMSVRSLTLFDFNSYLPYYSRYTGTTGGVRNYVCYERDYFTSSIWENGPNPVWEQTEQAYRDFVYEYYLSYPEEQLPNLTALCRENPQVAVEDITDFICARLRERDYTLEPGQAPPGKDMAEYFMFESREGYCQQFATAAALMYRIYGVPARYVTGYVVQPDDFFWEGGDYHAFAGDEEAHAWVEIYDETLGWTPVEVTFTSGSNESNTEWTRPDEDSEEEPEEVPDAPPEESQPEEQGDEESSQSENESQTQTGGVEEPLPAAPGSAPEQNLWPVVFWVAGVLLLLALLAGGVLVRRSWLLERYRRYGADQLFAALTEALNFAHISCKASETEEEFAAELSAAFPSVSREDAQRFAYLANRAAFGGVKPSREETKWAFQFYRQVGGLIYKRLNLFRKWLFKYGKVLL